MAKRTNRVAWGLVVVLAMVLLGGGVTMLYRGVSFPGGYVQVSPGRPGTTVGQDGGSWIVTRHYSLRYAVLVVSRTYSQQELPPDVAKLMSLNPPSRPPRTATPAGPAASTRSGTGR